MAESENDREQELLDRIHELRLLRDAQDPAGSVYRLRFQRDIEEATVELLEIRRTAPELERLDKEIGMARAALTRALRAAEPDQDPWSPAAITGCVIGGVLLLLGLWLSAGVTLSAVGVLFLAGGVGAVFASIRYRRDADVKVAAARDVLDGLLAERDRVRPPVSGGRPSGSGTVSVDGSADTVAWP